MEILSSIFSVVAMIAASFIGAVTDLGTHSVTTDNSPELQLAELSPEGAVGGFAVPASGCSGTAPPTVVSATLTHGHPGLYSDCPTVTVRTRVETPTGWTPWSSNNRTTDYDFPIRIGNSGSLPNTGGGTCQLRRNGTLVNSYSVASFTYDDAPLGPDASVTYAIRCRGNAENTTDWVSDSVQVTVPPASTANVRARVAGNSWENIGPLVITNGQNIHINWSSTDARSCSAVSSLASSSFSTGGNVSGTDTSITEPARGTSATYGVNCDGGGGDSADAIEVQNPALEPSIVVYNSDSEPAILVETGEGVTLEWNLYGNDPAACEVTGPGLTFNPATDTGTYPSSGVFTIVGESDFTIVCDPNTPSLLDPTVMVNDGGEETYTVNIVETSSET